MTIKNLRIIDYTLFRARIGTHDLRIKSSGCLKTRGNKISNGGRRKYGWNIVILFCIGNANMFYNTVHF